MISPSEVESCLAIQTCVCDLWGASNVHLLLLLYQKVTRRKRRRQSSSVLRDTLKKCVVAITPQAGPIFEKSVLSFFCFWSLPNNGSQPISIVCTLKNNVHA